MSDQCHHHQSTATTTLPRRHYRSKPMLKLTLLQVSTTQVSAFFPSLGLAPSSATATLSTPPPPFLSLLYLFSYFSPGLPFLLHPPFSSPYQTLYFLEEVRMAKFGSGPEPDSGFYIAVAVDGEMTLLVGDSIREAYARTKSYNKPGRSQALVLRREHVHGKDVYNTKARLGGKNREISIDCKVNEDAKLCFRVDKKSVLQIKGLKWKFRGHERIEVADGVWIQVSWDVYNWLFNQGLNKGQAVFVFKFENKGSENLEWDVSKEVVSPLKENKGEVWRQKSWRRFSMKGIEWRKMRKSLVRSGGS
ncbi:hypothetical protein CXB51_036522 [Gossypium anomalum]|uniref:Uncharacterized protein n=1 Tax=Gossypium anomalum TaxID=47600 RepID=A0A8J5XV59_9ROSI|nr:hypothetical protein CXB51_036522 [Gossypium anomalum]